VNVLGIFLTIYALLCSNVVVHLSDNNRVIVAMGATTPLLLSAPKCTMPASSKVRNDNLGRTAGVAAWAA